MIGQELTDWQSGVCCYHGFLLVERVDNGEQFYISVTDFVTEPYWEVTNANDVGTGNPCLAVYHQRSDYYPVDRDGKKYNAADGEVVMIFGATNWGGIDRETNQVDVLGANGRGFFNAEDLTVIFLGGLAGLSLMLLGGWLGHAFYGQEKDAEWMRRAREEDVF